MIFSDFYFDKDKKIEILPSDRMNEDLNVITLGDRLISVFRVVGTPFVADRMKEYLANEFKAYLSIENRNFETALSDALNALNFSCLCPPIDADMRPKSGAMALVIYIDLNGKMTFAQVGSICLKQKTNGKFVTLTKNHTFDNKEELDRLLNSEWLKESGGNAEQLINSLALELNQNHQLQYSIPSRFLGHPDWCGLGGGYEEAFISTKPFIGKQY